MPRIYRVTRTEAIIYARDYTREELEGLGVPAEVFTDGDITADFADAVASDYDLAGRLEEDTEPYGDVQGSGFRIASRVEG